MTDTKSPTPPIAVTKMTPDLNLFKKYINHEISQFKIFKYMEPLASTYNCHFHRPRPWRCYQPQVCSYSRADVLPVVFLNGPRASSKI